MTQSIFESIRHINEHDQEYWSARELSDILGYTAWRNFEGVIKKAIASCKNSKQKPRDHFADVDKPIISGKGGTQIVQDYHLSRYACYLIAQNGDPRKSEIAQAQTYFAIQTHRQETADNLIEYKKRVYLRGELTDHNKSLASTAKSAGVWNYGEFSLTMDICDSMVGDGLGISIQQKSSNQQRRSWITWEVRSSQPTSSAQRKQRPRSSERVILMNMEKSGIIKRSSRGEYEIVKKGKK